MDTSNILCCWLRFLINEWQRAAIARRCTELHINLVVAARFGIVTRCKFSLRWLHDHRTTNLLSLYNRCKVVAHLTTHLHSLHGISAFILRPVNEGQPTLEAVSFSRLL